VSPILKGQPPRLFASRVVGVWMWNVKTDIVQADADVCAYFSVPKEVGETGAPLRSFLSGIHEDDRLRLINRITRAIMTGAPFSETYRVVGAESGLRWVQANGTCFRDAEGRPETYPGTIVDVTDPSLEHPHTLIVEHLLEAHQLADHAGEKELTRLLEAVLLETGRRLTNNFQDTEGQ
jgi:hypothetical protein